MMAYAHGCRTHRLGTRWRDEEWASKPPPTTDVESHRALCQPCFADDAYGVIVAGLNGVAVVSLNATFA
jgi:hypothetical protein